MKHLAEKQYNALINKKGGKTMGIMVVIYCVVMLALWFIIIDAYDHWPQDMAEVAAIVITITFWPFVFGGFGAIKYLNDKKQTIS